MQVLWFDLGKYAWQDENWMKKRGVTQGDKAPISVYEVHLGSWKNRTMDVNFITTVRSLRCWLLTSKSSATPM